MKRLAATLALSLAANGAAAQGASVLATPHNLSVSGPGEIRATDETQVCKFCHVPHNATVPAQLWAKNLPLEVEYVTPAFSVRGRVETAPQPDAGSRLCLSCHDGTVALGDLGPSRPAIAMRGSDRLERGRSSFLGGDLSGSHPVSIALPEGADPSTGVDMRTRSAATVKAEGIVSLDAAGRIQCRTCHDPHKDPYYKPGEVPHFWVRPTVSEVCLACHELR